LRTAPGWIRKQSLVCSPLRGALRASQLLKRNWSNPRWRSLKSAVLQPDDPRKDQLSAAILTRLRSHLAVCEPRKLRRQNSAQCKTQRAALKAPGVSSRGSTSPRSARATHRVAWKFPASH